MKIIRPNLPADRYAKVRNDVIQHSGLSLQAVGLYAYLVAQPPGWSTTIERIAAGRVDGEFKVRGAFKELEEAKLIARSRARASSARASWAARLPT